MIDSIPAIMFNRLIGSINVSAVGTAGINAILEKYIIVFI